MKILLKSLSTANMISYWLNVRFYCIHKKFCRLCFNSEIYCLNAEFHCRIFQCKISRIFILMGLNSKKKWIKKGYSNICFIGITYRHYHFIDCYIRYRYCYRFIDTIISYRHCYWLISTTYVEVDVQKKPVITTSKRGRQTEKYADPSDGKMSAKNGSQRWHDPGSECLQNGAEITYPHLRRSMSESEKRLS